MYGGNPFSPRKGKQRSKRSKSNSHPDFSKPDSTLELLQQASRKLKKHESQQKRSESTPPRMFYSDPGQSYPQPFVIPAESDTGRYVSSSDSNTNSNSDSPTKQKSYQSSPDRSRSVPTVPFSFHLNDSFSSTSSINDVDTDLDIDMDLNSTTNSNNSYNATSHRHRSPSHSISTVAHDSPYRGSSLSSQKPIQTPPASNASYSSTAYQQNYQQQHQQHQHHQQQQQQQHQHQQYQQPSPTPPPTTLTVLLCDPFGGRAVLTAKAHANRTGIDKWELMDMFNLQPNSVGSNEISTEKIDAIFICANAEAEPNESNSLDVAISQFHFHRNRSINAPLFVIMIETNPQLIRSPGMCDRTTALARTVHARDILHISIPYGDAHVTTVASSGTLESHGVLERVSLSLVEFHSPKKMTHHSMQHIQQQQKRKSLSGSLWNHAGGLLRGSFHRNGGGQ